MCPDYSSFSAYIPKSVATQVSDVASFDHLVSLELNTSTLAPSFGATARSPNGFNCSTWDGTGLRYYRSTLCSYFVALGESTSLGSLCTVSGTVLPVCATSVQKFLDSWSSVFGSKTNCPYGEGSSGLSYVNALSNYTSGLMSTTSNCLVGELTDAIYCGFQTLSEAQAFCQTTTESCCANLATAATSLVVPVFLPATTKTVSTVPQTSLNLPMVSQATATVTSMTTTSTSTNLVSPAIAISAGSFVVVALLLAGAMIGIRRWREDNRSGKQEQVIAQQRSVVRPALGTLMGGRNAQAQRYNALDYGPTEYSVYVSDKSNVFKS
ncbi:hypothetical protein HDU84_005383 [Entophlyctis sp. JEL0112]|nr:hypothetical protein HDU84_005383 [Entophlyctis sp. JEL0112]